MTLQEYTKLERVAHTARDFHQRRKEHAPKSVTVVLSEEALVVTLHEALTRAEKAMSRPPEGAAQVTEFHRKLFQSSFAPLPAEIELIAGVAVREAFAEFEPSTGDVVQVFTTGTMVKVFQLDGRLSAETWNGSKLP